MAAVGIVVIVVVIIIVIVVDIVIIIVNVLRHVCLSEGSISAMNPAHCVCGDTWAHKYCFC